MSTRGRNLRGSTPADDIDEGFGHDRDEERFDHDTDGIVMCAAKLNAAAKALKKRGRKVAEKQKKEKSKNIEKYKSEYRHFYADVTGSVHEIEKILAQQIKSQTQQETSQSFSRKDAKYHSDGPRRRQRDHTEMSIGGFSETDGRQGKRKQSEIDQVQHLQEQIKQLQTENDTLKSDIQSHEAGIRGQFVEFQDENRRLSTEKKSFQTQVEKLQRDFDKENIAKTDAQGRIKVLNQEIGKLEERLVAETTAKDDANKKIQAMSHVIRSLEANLESEKTAIDGINKQFQTKCQEAEGINLMLKTEKNAKENVMRQMSQDIKSLEANLESERTAKDGIITQFQTKCQEAERIHLMLKTERNAKENVIRQMNVQHQEIKRLEASVTAEKAAKDDALRRLSAMVSSRLRDNNPNITDLSDQNRPTKLAEKMSELYDNEWTDAFDELEANASNIDFIKCLLETLMDIFNECKMWSLDNFFEKVLWTIERSYPDERSNYENTDVEVVLSTEMKQQIKEVKKTQGRKVLPSIEKMIYDRIPRLKQNLFTLSAMKIYIKKCIEISWLAVVQDPPLALNVGNSVNFDTKLFKEYLKRGPYVEFVVWPALHIEEGGALLCKGVAQGCKERKERQPATTTDE